MTDRTPPQIERNQDRAPRTQDETSRGSRDDGHFVSSPPVDAPPYRDDAETVRARRRELEAELGRLTERERALTAREARGVASSRWKLPASSAVLVAAARRATGAVAVGAILGAALAAGLATTAMALTLRDGVEIDPHAELAHRRAVARAIRHTRDLDHAAALRARDALSREAEVARVAESGLFGIAGTRGGLHDTSLCAGLPPSPVRAAVPAISELDLDAIVTELSDTVWDVDRGALDRAFESPSSRLVPHVENGRFVGAHLYGLRRSSLFGRLGFENGDLVVAVDREPFVDEHGTVTVGLERQAGSRVVIALVRRGMPRTHTYLLRGAPRG